MHELDTSTFAAEWSTPCDAVFAAFIAARVKMKPLIASREADTGKYKYNFASLIDVIEACTEALHGEGLAEMQPVSSGAAGIEVSTAIIHTSGQWIRTRRPLVLEFRGGAQEAGSAISYLRRYQLLGLLGMAPMPPDGKGGDDDDGKAHQDGTPPSASEPLCTGRAAHIATTNAARCEELAATLRKDKRVVWARACKASNVPMEGGEYPSPQQLYVSEGLRVSALLKSHLEDQPQPETERQPGDDDDDTGAPY